MRDILRQKLAQETGREERLNRTREFLQVLVLKVIFDNHLFNQLAFTGGTALRLLHGVRRYSEDLDFILVGRQGYRFKTIMDRLAGELARNNLPAETTAIKTGTVNSCFIKFPGLLQELGLAGLRKQKLSIKIEIDTNPPDGWRTVLVPVTETFVLAVNSLDLPSLYATKLHACFFRPYTKGRDYYDLVWYLGRRIEPNFTLLNSAIRQTEGNHTRVTAENLGPLLREKLALIDFKQVRRDVERFLEDKAELKLLERDMILKMIK